MIITTEDPEFSVSSFDGTIRLPELVLGAFADRSALPFDVAGQILADVWTMYEGASGIARRVRRLDIFDIIARRLRTSPNDRRVPLVLVALFESGMIGHFTEETEAATGGEPELVSALVIATPEQACAALAEVKA